MDVGNLCVGNVERVDFSEGRQVEFRYRVPVDEKGGDVKVVSEVERADFVGRAVEGYQVFGLETSMLENEHESMYSCSSFVHLDMSRLFMPLLLLTSRLAS